MAIWSRLIGGIAAIGVGGAAQRAIEPVLEPERQQAWEKNPVRVLGLGQIAELIAQGLLDAGKQGYAEASKDGFDPSRVDALVQAMIAVPGVAEALTLYRRNGLVGQAEQITDAQLEHVLTKLKIDPQYHSAIKAQVNLPLEPGQLAQGIHRGYIAYSAPGFVAPPSTPGKVPFYPQTNIDALATAAANGEDAEQLQVLVGIAGLPLSLFEMLELLNRDLVTEDDVKRAIANSNLQNQYMDVAINLRRMLLTPHEYAELFIRGWISKQAMYDGGALRGMVQGDMDLLAEGIGRPLAVHQVTTGLARGGTFGGDYEGVPEPYLSALRQSNVRPEWGNLAYANRYSYPSYFVIRPLVQSKAITVEYATQIFENEGWPPDLAAKAAASFATGGTATVPAEIKSATTKLLTDVSKAYIGGSASVTQVQNALVPAGLTQSTVDGLLTIWDIQRAFDQSLAAGPVVEPTT